MVSRDMDNSPSRAEVVRLFEQGITTTPYAWHGTSVEAIIHLANHGHLPTGGTFGTEFYYAPEYMGPGLQEANAKHFAQLNAQRTYIQQRIPFEPADKLAFSFMPEGLNDLQVFMAEAIAHGMKRSRVYKLHQEAQTLRKGVLLGLSAAVSVDFIESGALDDEEHYIDVPDGLALQFITGIEPLGDYEWEQMEQLQQSLTENS